MTATKSTELSSAMKGWRWRVFAATWLSYFGLYFTRKPFFIVKSSLQEELGFDPTVLAFIGSAYLIAYTVGQFLSGAIGNRIGPRLLLLLGMAVSIGANAAFGFANSWQTFAVFMAVNGLAQATGWPCNVGTMANWFLRKERGTVMGFWATNYQVGGVLANGLAAYMLGEYGFRYAFFAGSVVLCLVWIFFFFNQRNKPSDVGLKDIAAIEELEVAAAAEAGSDDGPPQASNWAGKVWTNVIIVGVFYFFVKFIRYALWSWAPYLLNRHYGLALDDAGYISTIFDLAGAVGVITAGILSDRVFGGRRAKVSFFFIIGMCLSCCLLYLAGGASLAIFGTAMGLIGFTLYGPDALMTGAGAIDVGSTKRATLAAGIINGLGSAGAVLQEFVLGAFLQEGNVGAVFAAMLTSSVLAAVMLGVLLARNKSGAADM